MIQGLVDRSDFADASVYIIDDKNGDRYHLVIRDGKLIDALQENPLRRIPSKKNTAAHELYSVNKLRQFFTQKDGKHTKSYIEHYKNFI